MHFKRPLLVLDKSYSCLLYTAKCFFVNADSRATVVANLTDRRLNRGSMSVEVNCGVSK